MPNKTHNDMKTQKKEKLGELLHDVAWGWQKQNAYGMGRSQLMYDCSLFDCQNPEDAYEPEIRNGRAYWECEVSSDCGTTWRRTTLSIPEWIYRGYLAGRATFISWRQVEAD